jgi:hypothetical protein
MNVAKVMKKMINEVNEGIDNIRLHLKPECSKNWNEGYAIANGLWYDDYLQSDYFDHDRFRFDVEQKIKAYFPKCEVIFRWRSQEVEVIKNA